MGKSPHLLDLFSYMQGGLVPRLSLNCLLGHRDPILSQIQLQQNIEIADSLFRPGSYGIKIQDDPSLPIDQRQFSSRKPHFL